jgi:hypothetical protein
MINSVGLRGWVARLASVYVLWLERPARVQRGEGGGMTGAVVIGLGGGCVFGLDPCIYVRAGASLALYGVGVCSDEDWGDCRCGVGVWADVVY